MALLPNPLPPGARPCIARRLDSEAVYAAAMGGFLAEGCRNGEPGFAVCTPPHHALLERYRRACHPGEPWIPVDAHAVLASILLDGRPDAALFRGFVDGIEARVPGQGPFRIVDDLVELLAGRGDAGGARTLEGYWQGYAERQPRVHLYQAAVSIAAPEQGALVFLEMPALPSWTRRPTGVIDVLGCA